MLTGVLTFEPVSFETVEQALNALKNGDVDCIFPTNFNDYFSENNGILLTPPLTRTALYTVVRSTEQKDITQEKSAKIAVSNGDANMGYIIKEQYHECEIAYFNDTLECLKAVSDGKADFFLISSYRYNSIGRICEKYHLIALDSGKDIPFCFAVDDKNIELYSILAKTTNIIPDSYVNNTLSHYFSEEGKTTLLDLIIDNIWFVIAVVVVIIAMLMLIIVQNRLIHAEKKANENRRIADDLSRKVYVDALTSVRNKGGYNDYIKILQERLDKGENIKFAVCMFDCDDLKYINDKYGHEKGDEYLKAASSLICRIFQRGLVFRVGGDEFTCILENEEYEMRDELVKKFEEESEAINKTANNDWEHVNVSFGIAQYDPQSDSSVIDTAARADEKMYENKRKRKAGRNIR